MSLATYADLKSACVNWARRSDLTNYLDDLITVAEGRIFREIRCREMEETLNSTISSGVVAVPADYVELKFAYVDGARTTLLQRKDPNWIYLSYPVRSSNGLPKFIAREGDNFIFGPYPDSGYTIKGVYYKELTAVQTTVNDLFTRYPDLYLSASLAEIFRFTRNDQMTTYWEGKYQDVKTTVNGESRMEAFSGGPIAMAAA